MKTVFKPMIVPPKDWKNVREGGFLECKNQEIKDK
jgi:DNA-directed RNA polymerase